MVYHVHFTHLICFVMIHDHALYQTRNMQKNSYVFYKYIWCKSIMRSHLSNDTKACVDQLFCFAKPTMIFYVHFTYLSWSLMIHYHALNWRRNMIHYSCLFVIYSWFKTIMRTHSINDTKSWLDWQCSIFKPLLVYCINWWNIIEIYI